MFILLERPDEIVAAQKALERTLPKSFAQVPPRQSFHELK